MKFKAIILLLILLSFHVSYTRRLKRKQTSISVNPTTEIGRGSFSHVYEAKIDGSNESFALKLLISEGNPKSTQEYKIIEHLCPFVNKPTVSLKGHENQNTLEDRHSAHGSIGRHVKRVSTIFDRSIRTNR